MIKDKFLNWLAIFLCLIVSSSMLLKGLPFWYVGFLIAFLLIGFYLPITEEEEDKSWPKDWEDYKATYEAPDEYNTGLNDKITKCKKCGNKVYEICMCKPINKK